MEQHEDGLHASSTANFSYLPRLPYESARAWSYRVLLHNIVHLNFPPGSCLVESEVRQILEVSRTPVREALMQLAQEKFVNIIPQKGTYVSRIDMSQVLDLRYIRRCAEMEAAKEACKAINQEVAAELHATLEQQRDAAERQDYEDFIVADDAMHKVIYSAAGRGGVWEFFSRHNLHHYRSRILGLRVGRTLARLIGEHEEIVHSLEEKDPDKAETCVRRHLSDTAWNADSVQEKYPDYIDLPK